MNTNNATNGDVWARESLATEHRRQGLGSSHTPITYVTMTVQDDTGRVISVVEAVDASGIDLEPKTPQVNQSEGSMGNNSAASRIEQTSRPTPNIAQSQAIPIINQYLDQLNTSGKFGVLQQLVVLKDEINQGNFTQQSILECLGAIESYINRYPKKGVKWVIGKIISIATGKPSLSMIDKLRGAIENANEEGESIKGILNKKIS